MNYLPFIFLLISLVINYKYPVIKKKDFSYNSNLIFTPAKYTFSIWGIIYFLLVIITILQILNFNLMNKNQIIYFIILCILNSSWIVFWFNDFTIICFFILIGMTYSNYLILNEKTNIFIKNIFGIYLSWCISATILNLNTILNNLFKLDDKLLKYYGVLLPLIIFHILYVYLSFKKFIPFLLVITLIGIWTFLGIIFKN